MLRSRRCWKPHELTPGENYFILLTTSSGFYRYDIHDLVRCVGYEGEAPLLEFLSKGAHFASVTGEKLSEFQAVAAMKASCEELNLPYELFTLAPEFGDPPGYVLLLEQQVAAGLDRALTRAVDTHLRGSTVNMPNGCGQGGCTECRCGRCRRARGRGCAQRTSRLGGSMEQYKHPCLVNDLGFLDQLLGTPATLSDVG